MQPEVVAGESVSATVVLVAKKPVPIEWVDADVIGEERARVGTGDNSRSQTCVFLHERFRIHEGGELPAGETRLPLHFEVPLSSPPSQLGSRGHVQYRIRAHVSIPWWPDAKRSFDVAVVQMEPNVAGRPVLFSTRADGPEGKSAHFECSLASDVLYPGGTVKGEIAFSNTAFNNYRGFVVNAVATERCRVGRRTEEHPTQRWTVRYDVDDPEDGESFGFQVRLPRKVLRSSESPMWSVSWKIEAEARIRWASDLKLSIPVTVLPKRYKRRANERNAPPSVGSVRMTELWTEVAEQSGLTFDNGDIIGARGDVAVRIQREHRGRSGLHLLATLSYPALGIGIEVVPSFRWTLSPKGLKAARAVLGRGYQVTGHDEEQVLELLRQVQEPMSAFSEAHLYDSEAQVGSRGGGATRRALVQFVARVEALALAMARARRALPPPVKWAGHLAGWQSLAESLGGRLSAAAMTVTGMIRDTRVEIAPRWTPPSDLGESDLLSTRFRLSPSRAIETAVGLNLRGEPGQLAARAAGEVAAIARATVDSALARACALQIERDALKVELAPAIVDPSGVLSDLTSLVDLASALSSAGGPYR